MVNYELNSIISVPNKNFLLQWCLLIIRRLIQGKSIINIYIEYRIRKKIKIVSKRGNILQNSLVQEGLSIGVKLNWKTLFNV